MQETLDMLRPTQTAGGEMTSPSHGERVAPGDDVAPGVATDLRVAYLVNQYPQPSQSFIRREIAALEKRGVAIERFTLRRSTTELVDPADQAEFRRTRAVLDAGPVGLVLAVARTAMTRPAHFARALALAWRVGKRSDRGRIVHLVYLAEACVLAGWLRRDTIRHLHAHFGTNSATVAMLSQAVGGPGYSFTVHGPEEFDKPEALGLGEKIARAEWVVGISQFGRSQLLRWCDFAHWDKVHVVHCGVDGAYFSATPTPPPTAPRLVCVARLSEQKGIPLLVAAAARLAAVGVDFELRLVGDGPLRPIVERLIAEHRLGNKIKLLGWQSGQEVQREIADARALVLPSFAEGLPVVIMESLAMHRPVVCTQIAGVGELVASGVCGWVVPAGAVDALAGAMREAIEASPERLLEMGGAGARLVAQRHNADQEAARLVELLQETAAK